MPKPWAPRAKMCSSDEWSDADRNCISNIRPAGLSYEDAAHRIAWHVAESLRRGYSGIALKDESAPADTKLRSSSPPASLK